MACLILSCLVLASLFRVVWGAPGWSGEVFGHSLGGLGASLATSGASGGARGSKSRFRENFGPPGGVPGILVCVGPEALEAHFGSKRQPGNARSANKCHFRIISFTAVKLMIWRLGCPWARLRRAKKAPQVMTNNTTRQKQKQTQ